MSNTYTDFREKGLIESLKTTIAKASDDYWVLNAKFKNSYLTTQTPWLRSTSGYVAQDSPFGKTYSLSFSVLAPQEQSNENTAMVAAYKQFNEDLNEHLIQIVKDNWETFMPGQELPNDASLKESLTSIIREEQPPYPERFQFRLNDMVEHDKFIGGVFEQTFDPNTQKLLPDVKQNASIESIRKHARVRMQIVLKGFYVSVKETEEMGEKFMKLKFGSNWMVQKILFYNVLGTLTDEETLKSFTFGDISVNETYSPDPEVTDNVKVHVVEKRSMEPDDGVLDGVTSAAKGRQPKKNKA